jgi:hypothetical protein
VLRESAQQSGVSLIPQMVGMPVSAVMTGTYTAKSGKYFAPPVLSLCSTRSS